MRPMRATGCCSAQPFLMASRATSGGSAACRLPSGMGWMWANSRPSMNASGGPAATPSRSHRARAPGTETALGRSSTPGTAKTLRASSSTTSSGGFCSSWVCGLVGVVLGRDPLLFGKTLSFTSIYTLPFCVRRRLVGSTVEFLAGLSSNLFGQDFLGPTQSRVGSRETDGGEGEDDGMQDLHLRNSDAEQLAHMRTHAALRLCAHGYTELDQAAFPLTQRPGVVLGGAQSVEGFLNRREAALEVLVDLRQVVRHALLLRRSTVAVSHATSRDAAPAIRWEEAPRPMWGGRAQPL